jgi:two-component system, sensor histidine kinase ChiS
MMFNINGLNGIIPPGGHHWWVYLFDGLLLLAVVLVARRFELSRIRLKNQLKLEKVEADALRKLDQMRSHFFANISHEFRTPLTLIMGQLESVMLSGIDEREKSKLEVATRNAHRLLTLINQILDLARLESGTMELTPSRQNIVSFLKSHFLSFESWAEAQHIKMLIGSEADNIPVVFDPGKMETIFYNLVSNAFKFTGPHGEVSVSIQVVEERFIEIRVRDNGPCIPAGQLPHIFDRFYHVDINSERHMEGTGIGLALAREMVELHHGKISVISSEGEGTVFIVTLPLGETGPGNDTVETSPGDHNIIPDFFAGNGTAESKQKFPAASSSGHDREIILVLEDHEEVRTFIREQMEADYTIIESDNGEAGLLAAQQTIPDLVICDVLMPKMDGYHFCRELRQDARTSHIPVIMLTAKAGFEDRMEGLETGADDFITKPFSIRELKVKVRNLTGQRRLLRSRFSLATTIKPSEVTATSIGRAFLEKTMGAIESNIENADFTIEMLAQEVNMSVSQLNRKLNAMIDQPAGQLMRSLRLQRAAELLEMKAGTVAQVAYKLGFNDQAYFSRAFKKQFGCSPSEYMNG